MTFTQSDFSFSLCNEVLLPMPFEQQCRYAADLGYKGLEVAPFTMNEHPESITTTQAQEWRRIAQDHGLHITGLHWLLVAPTGLSITDPDVAVRQRTRDFVRHLCECCAELGGRYLVHGSPRQREPVSGQGVEQAIQVASEFFADIAPCAHEHGLVYCIEPLSPDQTAVIHTLAQAIAIIEQVGHVALKTMLDTSSAARSEGMGIPELIDTYWPSGHLAHVQLNDPNRRAPGQGELRFGPILQALRRHRYAGAIAIEPFVYEPDGPGCAAFALGHLSALSPTPD
jgi:D-psicose/D-tagatose/L-ribulose 3-epimerase